MTDWAEPWMDPRVAEEQRALVETQFEAPPQHFRALAEAVRYTQCAGSIFEVGCASGYGREVLERAGVPFRSYGGCDISRRAIELARQLYPESVWAEAGHNTSDRLWDIVIEGCAVMHVEDWRTHLAEVCALSQRWLIMHRIPFGDVPGTTQAYGKTFPAHQFQPGEIDEALASHGFVPGPIWQADNTNAKTLLYARPRRWATSFDSAYWPRALAMWRSLKRHASPAVLHALCWDDAAAEKAAAAGMVVSRPEPREYPGPARTYVEKMWSYVPEWLGTLNTEQVTYIDADIWLHSSPEPLFAEAGGAGFVIPHGFLSPGDRERIGLPAHVPTVQSHSVFGAFNVGIVHFAANSLALKGWANDCAAWCYDHVAQGPDGWYYGDQKYLDKWPAMFGVHVAQHPGGCVGPWGVHARALDVRGGVIHFGNRPLVAYHYSGLKLLPHGHGQFTRPEYELTPRQVAILYEPYLAALKDGA